MIRALIARERRRRLAAALAAHRHIAWAQSLRDPDVPLPYALVDFGETDSAA